MTIGKHLTVYRVKRDHSDTTGFFAIEVPEASQRGFGFQCSFRGVVYGFSVHTAQRPRMI